MLFPWLHNDAAALIVWRACALLHFEEVIWRACQTAVRLAAWQAATDQLGG